MSITSLISRFDSVTELPAHIWERFGFMITTRAISIFSLPIEGEFWAENMNQNAVFGWGLAFTLDLLSDELVYKYGRIQQTVSKNSKKWKASRFILGFVAFNALASWFTSGWQMNQQMMEGDLTLLSLIPFGFALIQPVVSLGASYARAVQDGKYDEPETTKPEPKRDRRTSGKPSIDWWRERLDSLNGEREQMTPDRVREIVLSEWTESPGNTTLYNWSQEAKESANGHKAPAVLERIG